MKRMLIFVTAFAAVLFLGNVGAFAQHGGGHGGGGGMGPGASMGRGGDMGGPRGNGGMGGTRMGGPSLSHNSPTTMLSSNPKLASTLEKRVGPLLPQGMSMTEAASGFKNLGQFIAAAHVSHNLGIPFSDLKDKMMSGDSLGKAIKGLKPDVKSKAEAHKAHRQADQDLKDAETESESEAS